MRTRDRVTFTVLAVLGIGAGITLLPSMLAPRTDAAPAPTAPPILTPAPQPTAASMLVAGKLSHSTAPRVGSAILLELPVRNKGTSAAGVQLLVRGLGDQTFMRCKPACEQVDVFGTTVLAFGDLAPGKSITLDVIYQAVKPGHQSVTVALDVDLDMLVSNSPKWYVDFPILI